MRTPARVARGAKVQQLRALSTASAAGGSLAQRKRVEQRTTFLRSLDDRGLSQSQQRRILRGRQPRESDSLVVQPVTSTDPARTIFPEGPSPEFKKRRRQSRLTERMLRAIRRCRTAQDALDVLDSLRAKNTEIEPDVVVYTSIVNLASREKNVGLCRELLGAMIDQNVFLDELALNTLLKAAARARDLDFAKEVWQACTTKGVKPNVACVTTLLSCVSSRARRDPENCVALAEKAFGSLERRQRRAGAAVSCPDVAAHGALLHVYAQAGLWESALTRLHGMAENDLAFNEVCLCNTMAACTNAGHPEKAVELFEEGGPGCAPDRTLFLEAMRAYLATEKYDLVRALWNELPKLKLERGPGPLRLFALSLIRKGRVAEAVTAVRRAASEPAEKDGPPAVVPTFVTRDLLAELGEDQADHADALLRAASGVDDPNSALLRLAPPEPDTEDGPEIGVDLTALPSNVARVAARAWIRSQSTRDTVQDLALRFGGPGEEGGRSIPLPLDTELQNEGWVHEENGSRVVVVPRAWLRRNARPG